MFTPEDIKRLAVLAQLNLTAADVEQSAAKLDEIFALAEQMRSVDTIGVEPLQHPLAVNSSLEPALFLREDQVTELDQRANYQKIAPAVRDGLYLVPKVIE